MKSIEPKLEFNNNMAYLLGAYLGDGYAALNGKEFRLKGEITFTSKVAQSLNTIGLNPHIKPDKGCFLVQAASTKFILWLHQLSLKDIETMLVNDNLKLSFIEGFYDAEGYLGIVHRQNRTFPHIWVKIGNTNLPLLEMCQRLLTDLGIYSRVYLSNRVKPPRQAYYHLTVPSYYWTQNFLSKVESCIPHKGLIMLNDKLASYPAPRIRPKKRTLREAYRGF